MKRYPGNEVVEIFTARERATAEDTATAIDLLDHVACWIPSLPLGVLYRCRPLRGLACCGDSILGLTPQALCFRPLRGLTGRYHNPTRDARAETPLRSRY